MELVRIEAGAPIIEWDAEQGRMAILNPGDIAEVGPTLAANKIAEGVAKKTKKSVVAHPGEEPEPEVAPEPEPEPEVASEPEAASAADSDEAPAA